MGPKKIINIILIIVVLSLWGTVIYKYIDRLFYSETENSEVLELNDFDFDDLLLVKKDTFDLKELGRDPFLDKIKIKKIDQDGGERVKQKSISNVIENTEKKQNISFPSVEYYGYIKSKEKKEELILIKINQKLERVRLKSNVDGLLIEKIYKDSLTVKFGKEIKTIRRK